jgi:hypothetical protein
MSTPESQLPQFRIVVDRPSRTGPLGPYRFAICVVVALLASFGELSAIAGGAPAEITMLARALGVAVFTWIVLTVLDKVLAHEP